jgi:hypothetical protein
VHGLATCATQYQLITALLLMGFDFDTVDDHGQIVDPDSAPKPDWNDPFSQPTQGQAFLKSTRLYNPDSRVAGCQQSSLGPCEVDGMAALVQIAPAHLPTRCEPSSSQCTLARCQT